MLIKGRWREVESKDTVTRVPKTILKFEDLLERLMGPRKLLYSWL